MRSLSRRTPALDANAEPVDMRQREQWQYAEYSNGAVTVNCTVPHRHRPLIIASLAVAHWQSSVRTQCLMQSFQDIALARLADVGTCVIQDMDLPVSSSDLRSLRIQFQ